MNSTLVTMLRKLNDFVFIGVILSLMLAQGLLRKWLGATNSWLDLCFNILLSLCLFALFLKKYNPHWIRKVFMSVFFVELIAGLAMKKHQIAYSSEIVFIGFAGILLTWLNTHMNRKKTEE